MFFCAKRKAKVIRVKNYWKLSTNCYYLYTELKILNGQFFLFVCVCVGGGGGSVCYFFPSQGIERDLIKSQTKRWTQILQIKIQNYFLKLKIVSYNEKKSPECFLLFWNLVFAFFNLSEKGFWQFRGLQRRNIKTTSVIIIVLTILPIIGESLTLPKFTLLKP